MAQEKGYKNEIFNDIKINYEMVFALNLQYVL